MDSILFLFLTGFTGSTEFLRLRREAFGRSPKYPDNPVDPIHLFF
jgi:hypothetical protein